MYARLFYQGLELRLCHGDLGAVGHGHDLHGLPGAAKPRQFLEYKTMLDGTNTEDEIIQEIERHKRFIKESDELWGVLLDFVGISDQFSQIENDWEVVSDVKDLMDKIKSVNAERVINLKKLSQLLWEK